MSDERDELLASLLIERFGPKTRLLSEKSHDVYAERRRVLAEEAASEEDPWTPTDT